MDFGRQRVFLLIITTMIIIIIITIIIIIIIINVVLNHREDKLNYFFCLIYTLNWHFYYLAETYHKTS